MQGGYPLARAREQLQQARLAGPAELVLERASRAVRDREVPIAQRGQTYTRAWRRRTCPRAASGARARTSSDSESLVARWPRIVW